MRCGIHYCDDETGARAVAEAEQKNSGSFEHEGTSPNHEDDKMSKASTATPSSFKSNDGSLRSSTIGL